MIDIVVFGASGRMGREIAAIAQRDRHRSVRVIGGVVSKRSDLAGTSIPGIELPLTTDWTDQFNTADAIVDFSSEEGTRIALGICKSHKIPALIGTTGLSKSMDEAFAAAAEVVPIVRASNTSIGVTVLMQLASKAAAMLGDDFDVELVEFHHRMKKDAPSGTALTLANEVARAKSSRENSAGAHGGAGTAQNTKLLFGRSGGAAPRSRDELCVHAVRGGDVIGDHTLYFLGNNERLELTHRATSRSVFAEGALRAAAWLVQAEERGRRGVFSMLDVVQPAS